MGNFGDYSENLSDEVVEQRAKARMRLIFTGKYNIALSTVDKMIEKAKLDADRDDDLNRNPLVEMPDFCHILLERNGREEQWILIEPLKKGNKWIAPDYIRVFSSGFVFKKYLEQGEKILVQASGGWNLLLSTDKVLVRYKSKKISRPSIFDIKERGKTLGNDLGLL